MRLHVNNGLVFENSDVRTFSEKKLLFYNNL